MTRFSLRSVVKQYRWMIFLSTLTAIMMSSLALSMPIVLKLSVDRVIPAKDWGLYFLLSLILIVIYIIDRKSVV